MDQEQTVIEAEVVTIDGVEPSAQQAQAGPRFRDSSVAGKIFTISPVWFPVIAIAVLVLIIPIVVLGMCVAVLLLALWLIRGFLRLLVAPLHR